MACEYESTDPYSFQPRTNNVAKICDDYIDVVDDDNVLEE